MKQAKSIAKLGICHLSQWGTYEGKSKRKKRNNIF